MSKINAHRDTFTTPTESLKKVAFRYGLPLDLMQSGSSIDCLLEIGALLNTRRYVEEIGGCVTATDREGLVELIASGNEAVTGILMGVSAVGKALVYACPELNEADISDLGWLINGLGNIAVRVNNGIAEIKSEIERDFGGNEGVRS